MMVVGVGVKVGRRVEVCGRDGRGVVVMTSVCYVMVVVGGFWFFGAGFFGCSGY